MLKDDRPMLNCVRMFKFTKLLFLTVFMLCALCVINSGAQQVSGEWYGIGNVNRNGEHSSYLSELILVQKGNKVTGEFNYYFKSASIVSKITGTYDPKTRTLELRANPVLNYKARNINGADCPMEGSFTLQVSRVESSLRGQFNPTVDYRFTCPAINIKFVKQVAKPKKEPEPEKQVTEPPIAKAPMRTDIIIPVDTMKVRQEAELVALLIRRTFEVSDVIEVDADSLKLSLYDNGEVDGDTISLFQNRKLIAAHQLLATRPFNITIPLDTTINEISMLAENLGSIPPNTALCVIYAGTQRFELSLSSSFIKNAAIRFRKKAKVVTPQ